MFAAVIVVLLMFIAGVLLIPLRLEIDTERSRYLLKAGSIISIRVVEEDQRVFFLFRMPLFSKKIFPGRPGQPKAKPKDRQKKKSGKGSMTSGKFLGILKSFRIREFRCSLDTGDYVYNALLLPLIQRADHYRGRSGINFNGQFYLRFIATNTIWRIGKAYVFNK